ncbi:MAG: hypothetical protein IKN17_03985 [Ruminococcus sp.]|nr:hypothetical protein [Ruminococcus sp.]
MSDKNNYIFPDSEKLEAAYLDSLRKLSNIDSRSDPIDAHKYKDPETKSPEVYEKMVSDIKTRREEKSNSIWRDENSAPPEKSIWLDKEPEAPKRAPEPEKRPARTGTTKRTIEIQLSEDMRRKMSAARQPEAPEPAPAEEPAPRRQRPVEDVQPSPRRQRPVEDVQPSSRRQRPVEDVQPSSRRQRPVEDAQPSPRRQRPVEDVQPSSRRQRPVEDVQPSPRRQRPVEDAQPSSRRQRPVEDVQPSSRVRERARLSPAEEAVLQRPRRKKPKFRHYEAEFSFLNAALCILIVFGAGIALLVMKRESGVVETENRMYAEMPSFNLKTWFSGEFTEGVTTYYTDTIPNRESLKGFSDTFSNLFGINIGDVKVVGDVPGGKKETLDDNDKNKQTSKVTLYTGPAEKETEQTTPAGDDSAGEAVPGTTPSQTTSVSLETKKHIEVPDEGEWAGNVVITGSGSSVRAMPAFYGLFDVGADYASVLNQYKTALGDKVNVFNLYCPLASAYYMPKNMADQFTDQHEAIINVGNHLQNVINVDVYETLANHADEYIYSRTDHHWQPLGAYYAMSKFVEDAGLADTWKDLSTYEKCVIDGFVGTMYAFSNNNQEIWNNPETMTYYKPDNNDQLEVNYWDSTFSYINENKGHSLFFDWVSGQNCYGCTLGDDLDICEIKTPVKNGRVLVILKDSYANATVPFLTHSFEKIYVADFRYVNVSMVQFAKSVGATDFCLTVSISGGHTQTHIDRIRADM